MDAYTGEIRILPYTFAPYGWSICAGQIIPIAQNEVLYAVIGATYGGNWRTTMGIPNLMGRAPMGAGTGPGLPSRQVGESGGSEEVIASYQYLPAHIHQVEKVFYDASSSNSPEGTYLGRMQNNNAYKSSTELSNPVNMAYEALSEAGSNVPHENRQPFLAMQYCLCTDGYFPSRN
jgi:microcystin-dependent protein